MPDRDIFRLTVDHGWKAVARRVFRSDLDDWELGTVIKAVAKDFQKSGCPDLDKIVHIRINEDEFPLPSGAALDQLQEFRLAHGVELSGSVVRAVTRVLSEQSSYVVDVRSARPSATIRRHVAREVIIDHVRGKTMPIALQRELTATGEFTTREIIKQGHLLSDRLKEDPRVDQLVDQLLRDPSGGEITLPANPRRIPDQKELLGWDLS